MPTFWFPNDGTGEGERLGSIVPVPDTPEVWGLLLALSVTVKIALRVSVEDGVWGTLMEQVAPVAKVDGALLVGSTPPLQDALQMMLVMLNAVVLGLESVTA